MLTKLFAVACRSMLLLNAVGAINDRLHRWLEDPRSRDASPLLRRLASGSHERFEDAINLSIDHAGRVGDRRHRRREAGEGRLRILVARVGTRVGLRIAKWSLDRLYYWNVYATVAGTCLDHLDDVTGRVDRVSWDDFVRWVDMRRDEAQV